MMDDVDLCAVPIVGAAEGCAAVEAFVKNDSDTPPVATTIVGMSEEYFRRHVLCGAHDAACETSSLCSVAVGQ